MVDQHIHTSIQEQLLDLSFERMQIQYLAKPKSKIFQISIYVGKVVVIFSMTPHLFEIL